MFSELAYIEVVTLSQNYQNHQGSVATNDRCDDLINDFLLSSFLKILYTKNY